MPDRDSRSSSLSGMDGLEMRARQLVDELAAANEVNLANTGRELLRELEEVRLQPPGTAQRRSIVSRLYDFCRQSFDRLMKKKHSVVPHKP
jgi:hypothetical protein